MYVKPFLVRRIDKNVNVTIDIIEREEAAGELMMYQEINRLQQYFDPDIIKFTWHCCTNIENRVIKFYLDAEV